jgi:hypothetical protein
MYEYSSFFLAGKLVINSGSIEPLIYIYIYNMLNRIIEEVLFFVAGFSPYILMFIEIYTSLD